MKQYKINVKPISTGDSTLTIVTQDSQCYTNPADVSVSAQVKKVLTPQELSTLATSGQAANSLAIGDLFPVTFNGALSDGLTLNDQTFYAALIGINHNASIEGTKRIHLKCPYNSEGKQLVFTDNKCLSHIGYGNATASGAYFNMNNAVYISGKDIDTLGYSAGGYVGSNMKKNIMPKIKAAMEPNWQNVIRACTKYSDNNSVAIGTNIPDVASYVTPSQEALWLLDEFEFFGERGQVNSACQNYQKHYQYYINGNSVVHYRYDTERGLHTWARSVIVNVSYGWCCVNGIGGSYSHNPSISLGVTFGFTL